MYLPRDTLLIKREMNANNCALISLKDLLKSLELSRRTFFFWKKLGLIPGGRKISGIKDLMFTQEEVSQISYFIEYRKRLKEQKPMEIKNWSELVTQPGVAIGRLIAKDSPVIVVSQDKVIVLITKEK